MFGGGFGNNQTSFGQQQQQTPNAFGQPQGSSLFGQQQTPPQSGFGGTGAFGQPQQPAGGMFNSGGFGATNTGTQQAGGMFGSAQPSTSAFGGGNNAFGSQQQNTTSSAFGGGGFGSTQPSQSGSMFGQSNQTNGGMFGAKTAVSGFGATGSSFGSAPATSAFGSTTSNFGGQNTGSAFGSAQGSGAQTTPQQNQGTGNPSFSVTNDKEGSGLSSNNSHFQTITAMPSYRNFSLEELRVQDYLLGKKFSSGNPAAPAAFGMNSGFGGATTGGMFGGSATNTGASSGFGAAPSAFGAQPAASAFGGFGAAAQQKPTGFGGFGSTNTSPAFGAQANTSSTGFGGFGSTQPSTTSAFGSTQPASTGFGFGGQQQQPASTGLFGQPAQPAGNTGMFGSAQAVPTSTSGFGGFGSAQSAPSAFGSTQPASTGFGFSGQQQQPASTGLFGQPAQPAGNTGMFGSATTPASGGLFGSTAPKPAATSGFGFGAPASQPSMFGNTQSSSLFPTPAPTTGMFGAAQPQQGGLFGSQPAATGFGTAVTSNLFGPKPASNPTSLFGGGAFGVPNTQPFGQASTGGFGLSTAGASNMFGNSMIQANSLQASIDKNPYGNNPLFSASLDTNAAIAEDSATNNVLVPKRTSAPVSHYKVTPRSVSKMRLRGFGSPSAAGSSSSVGSLGSSNNSRPQDPGTPKDDQAVLGLDPRFQPRKSVKKLVISRTTPSSNLLPSLATRQNVSFDPSLEDRASTSNIDESLEFDHKTPSKIPIQSGSNSVLKSATPAHRRASPSAKFSSPSKTPVKPSDYETNPSIDELLKMSDAELRAVPNFQVSLQDVGVIRFLEPVDLLDASPTKNMRGISQICGNVIIISPKLAIVYPDDEVKPPVGVGLNVPANIKLYKCWPLDKSTRQPITDESDPRFDAFLEKLERMSDTTFIGFNALTGAWKFRVEHFSRYGLDDDEDDEGRVGVDESMIDDSFAHVASRRAILQGRKQQELKLDDDGDVDVMDYEEDVMGFESDGSLLPSTDDDAEYGVEPSAYESDDYDEKVVEKIVETFELPDGDEDDDDIVIRDEFIDREMDFAPPPTSVPIYEHPGVRATPLNRLDSARKLGMMKAVMFGESSSIGQFRGSTRYVEDELMPMPLQCDTGDKRSRDWSGTSPESVPVSTPAPRFKAAQRDLDAAAATVPDEIIASPKVIRSYEFKRLDNIAPLKSKVYSQVAKKIFVDAGLALGRSFRVGWGPNGEIVTVGSFSSSNRVEFSKVTVKKVVIFGFQEREKHRTSVKVLLENTIINENKSTFPEAATFKVNSKLQFARIVDAIVMSSSVSGKAFSEYEMFFWKLCCALWDENSVDSGLAKGLTKVQIGAINEALRKEDVSHWLKEAIKGDIDIEIQQSKVANSDFSHAKRLFALLSGRQLAKAIDEAISHNDLKLALIISQVHGAGSRVSTNGLERAHGVVARNATDEKVYSYISDQIQVWKKLFQAEPESKVLFNEDRMRCWTLCGGLPLDELVSIVEQFKDWKRIFGMILWYREGGSKSLKESIDEFSSGVASGAFAFPNPPHYHSSTSIRKPNGDCLYNMMKLFSGSLKLETQLLPSCFTVDVLDHRMPWVLATFLHRSFPIKDQHQWGDLTMSFIFQLELLGLWDMGCFVALFLVSANARSKAIRYLLDRNYPQLDISGSCLNGMSGPLIPCSTLWNFLVGELHIPKLWIYEAKV